MTPEEAIKRAWVGKDRNQVWHRRDQNEIRKVMPDLAEAIERLVSGDDQ